MSIKKDIESFYPLSPMQQGMLFHTLYDDGSGMYVEQLIIPLYSKLNIGAFQRAWEQVVQRHSIFRTTFVWEGIKTPVQVVHRRVELPWELADWRGLAAAEQQARLKAFLDADRQRGFDLAHAPLMRLSLFQIADDTYQFVWSQHHMLLDGWSLPLVLNEVFACYEAAIQGREAPLPRPRPYRDYIAWLQQQDLAQAETFWRQFLAGFTASTPLGVDRALGPDSGPAEYEELERLLPAETASALQALARQHGLTLNTVMQGAWALLLSHYSGESDVVFGATVSGRPAELAGVEQMVGLFINTLPVRVQIHPAMTLLAWLKEVQTQQAELRQYEYSPLVQIQGWSDVPRGQQLFESLVVFENYPAASGSGEGNGARPSLAFGKMQAVERTNYPLNLMAGMGAMRLNYDRRRFDAATIERMLGHLETVLACIAAQPHQRLADLTLLTAAERQQQRDWNTTTAPFPQDQCLHQLVAAQAARTPDHDAVVFGGERLTYAELNARANQLAHYLQALGVGPDVGVGLCVERSLDAMVGVLGILKAGGAYVPLDPAYPSERLAFMLADARVPVLLTQQHLGARLPQHQARVICLDTDWPTIAQSAPESPVSLVSPDHLAYVIYTSGSTGQPKGVGMPHRPLVNLLAWQQATIPGARRTLQFAPLSFDVSCQEIFSAWSTGGTLVLVSEELRRDAPALLRELDTAAVERLFVPFVALQHLAEQAEDATGLRHLREIITAGEQLQITPALARWLAAQPSCTLHNHYGPTESHVVTAWTLTGAPADWPTLPPIGVPVANAESWLLNGAGQPVPVGVVGELYIGGAALARGYLNRPELTAERFIPNPFSSGHPGARLYKTGDLGRYLPNGAIEYVGRSDQQVKVRGYRIEVGEIEAVLAQHPGVREAVVVAREDTPAGAPRVKRLVAYVVENQEPGANQEHDENQERVPSGQTKNQGESDSGSRFRVPSGGLSSAELRQFLGARLPDYMVPSSIVFLEHLPLTPSGKVNRRALPAPDQLRPELGDGFVAPRTPVEEMLAQIWAEVLQVDRVGAHDSFFELGGHSLLATQVISRVREVCQVELPLRSLFEAPTVAGLAERVANARFDSPELAAPPIRPVPHDGPLPLSFAQQRLWFFDQLQPESAAYNISTALRFEGELDVTALEQSLNEIVRRHESLRTVFTQDADLGHPVQIITPVEPLTLPLISLDFLPEDERFAEAKQMASEEAERPFDLQTGPLLRATLLRLDPTEHVLLLNMHHIVSDGWSMGVFMRELATFYKAFATGTLRPQPELPIQYADYAIWQRNWLQGAVLAAQLDYWKQQLANVPALQMPTDYPRPAAASLRGVVQEFDLPKTLSESLVALGRREGATLFMTLLTAWQVLLGRYSGQDDIAVGTPIANRTRGEVESLIGYFVNTLVLRTDLSGAATFREALQRVRATALGAYAHQDLPFEQIVDAVQPERDLSRHAIFQVMFVLQNAPMDPLEMPGLLFTPLVVERTTTRFDLTLTMAEGPSGLTGALEYSTDLFEAETIARLIAHFQTLLTEITAQPTQQLARLSLLTPAEEQQLLVDWNATAAEYPYDACIHTLFAAQAARTPDAVAVSFEGAALTYGELDARANQLARYLQALGVGPDVRVGIYMERSLDLVVGLFGILKAGGAYLPLDPSYPTDRLGFMVADSAAPVLLTQRHLVLDLPEHQAQVVCVDTDWPIIARSSAAAVASAVTPDHLAYVIYTSGSTGKPKGVMVPHRGVVNFFTGMDERIGDEQPGIWLAVTSVSFDISVLELFWTLTRGFQVVVQREADYSTSSAHASKEMQFSLFYFASDNRADARDKYRLLIEGAKFADEHGFTAVWTPERHFHAFGGLYPNPSVTSAAIATITERVQIRAGSVVLPLHSPIRVAEEWSVVDNLSNGRVGISFASGWHADDFVFAPSHFAARKKVLLDQIETVRKLWRGEAVPFEGGAGNQVDVTIVPSPVQRELPIWLTASGAPETFQTAGALGIGVLTHLLGQTVEGLAEKIALYRAAWREHGHPGAGHVTLMLHTFVGKDLNVVREKVRQPFTNYLRTSLDLIGNLARSLGRDPNAEDFSADDMEALLEHAFERYFETSSLMGTPDTCLQTVDRLKGIGVDEVACLIDFGVDARDVVESLDYLVLLKERSNRYARARAEDYSVLAQLSRYGVSHMQCTPSMASMLLLDPQALTAMLTLRKLMLGGEALPLALADQLTRALPAELHNMYGPTETTIWSTTQRVLPGSSSISIGRPIVNTEIYILDRYFQPTAIGIPGELLIGGDGLVRGYLNRPELTAERFVPHPFSVLPGARLYKTGDLARYRADGTIEYLSRVDTQVKIRGYRIEVGEIEAVLGEHPEVREAVVVARDAADSSVKRLVAYVVPHSTMPGMNELRSFLETRLPGYMVPSAIMALESLPLTPNGKVDRQALPAPDQLRPDLDTAFVAPQTPIEELLANIWADVLQVEEIGVTDNFFSLGGNSLLATLLVSRMRDAFQVELPVRTLFEAPTIAGLTQRILQARTEDSSLLPPPLVPVPREGALPLSFAQQRLWFINRLQPDNPAYNEPTAIRLSGPFDIAALERTLNTIVRRHEALRTTFTIQDGAPVQIITVEQPLPLQVIDLQAVPVAEREAEARRLARDEARHLFDLERGPLFRVTLLRIDPEDHVVLLTLHHIISDGWSNSVIVQELTSLYNADVQGAPITLPELPIQYADYAIWQREWLQGEVMEAHVRYWRQQLGDVPVLQLPTDHPRPTIVSFEGAVEHFVLPQPLTEALNTISRREGVTLFMTMLAGLQMLLARYSGQDDIAVGTPIAGRNQRETEGMIGFFINTLVLRTDLSANPSFREVLQRVREVCLGAYTHQDLPFEQVVDAVQPERDMSRQPLFQVMFALHNAPAAPLELQDVTISPLSVEHTSAKFDLDLSLAETETGMVGSVHYSTDLFEAATIRRMLTHFRTLLEGIAANPNQRLAALPLVDEAERQHLLTAWNPPATPYPRERCVHTLVAEQAARRPDAIAVVFPDEQCTYAELNRRANQLAHHVQALGVREGIPVGICLERSLAFVVGVLAILKAGGAYVPLDPSYPSERLQFMLQDTQTPVLITTSDLAEHLPPHYAHVVLLDTEAAELAAQPSTDPVADVTAEDLAYLIYTSGSTGQPKGIGIPHRAITRLACNTNYVQFTADDRIGMVSNVSFDAATMELWGALLNGGRMVGVPREVVLSPQAFADYIRAYRIDTMFLTSALFNQMAREVPQAFAPMRDLLVGGEALDPRSIRTVLEAGGPRRLLNGYGPTESTTFAAWYEITEVPPGATTIPIGYPLANTQLYVLDDQGAPVPVGVPGELYIGGAGLAHGYLNQSVLTAEKFVPDPFSGVPGARLYRTGDVVRYRADGAIEFIGRRDLQVKVRGFRIELGEIEAALGKHPAVGQVAVVAREDVPGQKYLAAYVVAKPGQTVNSGDLRQFAQMKLPGYMVPSALITLDAFPLTPNGKLDRSALPVPDQARLAERSDYIEPRDVVELDLVRIWEEVLNVWPISVTDNFFDLGGHSLLVVRLMTQIQQHFGRELSLATIFQGPTIEQLACVLREQPEERPWSPLVPIQTNGSKPPLFCVHPAGGTAFCYIPLSRYLGPDQPCYGLQAMGLEEGQMPYTRIEEIAGYYVEAVRQAHPEGPYMLTGWSLGGIIAFEMAQQLRRQNQEVALLALLDTELPPPELQRPDADLTHLLSDANLLMMMVRRKNLPMSPEEFQKLSPEEQLNVAVETARRTNIIPPDAGPAQVQRFMQVLKANFGAMLQYMPQVYPDGITYLKTEEPYDESMAALDNLDLTDPARGWSKYSGLPIEVYSVPGDHTTMLLEPHVSALAAQLANCMEPHQSDGVALPPIASADLV